MDEHEVDEYFCKSQLEKVFGRILDIDRNISVDTAALDMAKEQFESDNYSEYWSEIILDVIKQYHNGKLTRTAPTLDSSILEDSPSKKDKNDMEVDDCPKPTMSPFSPSRVGSLCFLIDCYRRANDEIYKCSKNFRKIKSNQLNTMILESSELLKVQLVRYAISLLGNKLIQFSENQENLKLSRSPLLQLMYENSVPGDFMNHLMRESMKKSNVFNEIFTNVLDDLYIDMQNAVCNENIVSDSLERLRELTEVKVDGDYPICRLIVNHKIFLPKKTSKKYSAREVSKVSYLAPFMSLSVLVEENPKFSMQHFNETMCDAGLVSSFQSVLLCTRKTLHQLFLTLITNMESRNEILNYISVLLKNNQKRSQFNSDDRFLAKDGFMINLMSGEQFFASIIYKFIELIEILLFWRWILVYFLDCTCFFCWFFMGLWQVESLNKWIFFWWLLPSKRGTPKLVDQNFISSLIS